jgi:hypothetical protein
MLSAMIDTAKIAESVEREIEALRQRMRAAPGSEVYDHVFSIFASEQMACLLMHSQDEIIEVFEEYAYNSGARRARATISRLEGFAARGCVLATFVDWFLSRDSVNLSDMDETMWTLQEFLGISALS